jgi:predicted dehydrogenase
MSERLNWGIIGTGRIASVFAEELPQSQTGNLLAVGSRTQENAARFADTWHVPRCYSSYEQLLADPDVQAVYISVPHPLHAEWAIKAADAGKHILCEKPIALNHAQALKIIEAAQRNDVFLMEAFMYRGHPQIARLRELLHADTIGDIRVVQATFSFHAPFAPIHRLLNNTLGGGGILDVGCYCVSMARLIAGIAISKDFAEPTQLTAAAHIGEVTHVDEYAVATLTFPGDILAQLFAGVQVEGENVLRIFGSQGSIVLPDPFTPHSNEDARIFVKRDDTQNVQEVIVPSSGGLYANEADNVTRYLAARQSPYMTWEDTLGNMQTLDRWRAAIGLIYDAERSANKQ